MKAHILFATRLTFFQRAWLGLLALAALHLPHARAGAQQLSVGVAATAADYREQGSSLRFEGGGLSAHLDTGWRRFGLRLTATQLTLEPSGAAAAAAEPFDLTQFDVRVRARLVREYSVEAGMLRRTVVASDAAQEVGAVRVGALASYALAPGASLTARAAYLGAARFSGGGTAPFGAEVGLGASYGPGRGRLRAFGDFELQHFGRRTTVSGARLQVPIQSSVARLGVAFTR